MSFDRRKVRVGKVVSDKMEETVVVLVEWRRPHRLYRKAVRRRSRFKAHDESNACRVGDLVRIIETRPLSKSKRWRVLEILAREEIAELQPEEIDAGLEVAGGVTGQEAEGQDGEARVETGRDEPAEVTERDGTIEAVGPTAPEQEPSAEVVSEEVLEPSVDSAPARAKEAPAPKPRARRKATEPAAAEETPAEVEEVAEEAVEEAPTPKPRPRARRKAAEPAAAEEAPADVEPVAEEAVEEAPTPKPKPRARARKKPDEAVSEEDAPAEGEQAGAEVEQESSEVQQEAGHAEATAEPETTETKAEDSTPSEKDPEAGDEEEKSQ